MKTRFNLAAAPEAYRGLAAVDGHVKKTRQFPLGLLHMLKLRASQINACAYCIDMHWKDAKAAGESDQRLYGLSAWEESPYYSDRERAALAWTEVVTNLNDGHVSDAAYDAARTHFSEQELADLTWAIAAINAWNRLAIASRSEPGSYKPVQRG
jgi:AhpD family alkylhydroperoxidase